MPGLLDLISSPTGQGLLTAAFGGLAGARRGQPLNTLGRAGLLGLGGFIDAADRRTQQDELTKRNQLFDLQLEQAKQAQADANTQRANEAAFRSAIPSPQQMSLDGALAGGGGPTTANAARLTAVDPRQQLMWQAMSTGQIKPMEYITATAKDKTPIKLGKDDRLLEPGTNRVLVDALPDPAKGSPIAQLLFEMNALQPEDPRRAIYQDAIRKATTHQPATAVNVDLKQEGAYRAAQGKEFSDFMASVNKSGFMAPAQIRKLERMEQLLSGVDGGKLAPTGLDVASAANSIGIKLDPRLGNKEAAQALAREIAGGFRQPGTGPMTDKDFENFLLQVPDLSKTAEGRKQITSTMKSALARDMALAKKAREYEKRNGQLDSGFMDEAAQFIAENPVVGLPQGWKVR